MRDRLIDIIKQCACPYAPPCDGDCGMCSCSEIYDKQIEYIADTILASGIIPVIGNDDTVCDHCACVLLDQRDEARELLPKIVRKMQENVTMHFGTYTDKDEVKVLDVINLINRITEKILEEIK